MESDQRDSFQTTLPPPFVSVPGLHNIRDLGSWPITHASTRLAIKTPINIANPTNSQAVPQNPSTTLRVRAGIFFRSDDVTKLQTPGIHALQNLNITKIFDIRSVQQIARAGHIYSFDGITRVWAPIFSQEEYTPEKAGLRYKQYAGDGTEGIVGAFQEILVHGATTFRAILLQIAGLAPYFSDAERVSERRQEDEDHQEREVVAGSTTVSPAPAILIHCTTGNNRSGALIGVLLSLIGVPDPSIADEYALSDVGLAPTRHISVARLIKNPVFAAAFGDEAEARAERMLGARRESMLAMLEMVEKVWGGAEEYVKVICGLSDEEVGKVRLVLTERISADETKKGSNLGEP